MASKIIQLSDGTDNLYPQKSPTCKSNVVSITPLVGSNYSAYGNTYYYKEGSRVHLHIGVSGMSQSASVIATLPVGYRPMGIVFGVGTGGGNTIFSNVNVQKTGAVTVWSQGTYCGADLDFDTF